MSTQNCSPGTQNYFLGAEHGVLEAGTGVLEARLGGLDQHLGDYCVLLIGLGRFQNALGTFQEAPERESLILHWVLEGVLGGALARAIPRRPLKSRFFKTDQTPQG